MNAATSKAGAAEAAAAVARLKQAREKLRAELGKVVVGQERVLDSLLIGLLCRGHVLMLGLPGLGKTLMARTIARALDMASAPDERIVGALSTKGCI